VPEINRETAGLMQLLEPVNLSRLLIELSVIAEVGRPLVTVTYILEGDGSIVLSAFRMIQEAKHRVKLQTATDGHCCHKTRKAWPWYKRDVPEDARQTSWIFGANARCSI